MRLAYADPPYLGCARRYPEHPDAGRWDDAAAHGQLMAEMAAMYDGWALSLSAKSLPDLLPLAPAGVRVGAWAKPFSAFKKHVRIAYTWEPLIFSPARPNNDADAPCTRDSLTANMGLMTGTVGGKPPRFCRWVLDLLGYLDGDTVDDLFPGSGVMGHVAAQMTFPSNGGVMSRPRRTTVP